MDELVALYDAGGAVVGAAPRSRVYAQGLWHAATAVLVVSPGGDVYVHRRSSSKGFAPDRHDCFAGGVVGAGELPDDAAVRELGEELAIVGVALEPLLRTRFVGSGLRYHVFAYRTCWDGPVVHDPAEVAAGAWQPWSELLRRLDDPSWPFVPDGRQVLTECLQRGLLP